MSEKILTDKFLETLKYEGSVSLTSWGSTPEPHATGTWLSYLSLTDDGRLLAPAAGMTHLEADIATNPTVLALIGIREVEGRNGYQGIGFRLSAHATLLNIGAEFDAMKAKYPFARQVLELTPQKLEQLL